MPVLPVTHSPNQNYLTDIQSFLVFRIWSPWNAITQIGRWHGKADAPNDFGLSHHV